MTYVYCVERSHTALELVTALGAHRLRKFDGLDFWDKRKRCALRDGDVVVCWGSTVPELEGIRVLNGYDQPLSSFREFERLTALGIPTQRFIRAKWMSIIEPKINRVLSSSGSVLSVQRETYTNEYRIHSFEKRSIRAGIKVPRDGFTPCVEAEWQPGRNLLHPWFRSFDCGWRVDYDFKSSPELRKFAHRAVTAIGVTFGAVDIGRMTTGLRVIKIDRAPRLDPGTVSSYTRAITRWIKGGKNDPGRILVEERTQVPEPEPDLGPEPDLDQDPEFYDV